MSFRTKTTVKKKSKGPGSVASFGSKTSKKPFESKEEQIGKRIETLLKQKEAKIYSAIMENIEKIYIPKKQEVIYKFDELDRERAKIIRKKKKRREKKKLLVQNTRKKFTLITRLLNESAVEYRKIYYEDDYYRQKKLIEITEDCIREAKINQNPDLVSQEEEEQKKPVTKEDYETMDSETQNQVKKSILAQIKEFYSSPYEDDKRFAVSYIARITREDFGQKELVNHIFFYLIFDLILESQDERIIVSAYDSLCNLTQDDETRKKLAQEDYYKKVYESIDIYECSERVLDKVSWLTTLICFYQDMIDEILELGLLGIILEL